MDKCNSIMAQQIGAAASAFEQSRTTHRPESVTVIVSDTTLVITLHVALSPAERALARSPTGAAKLEEFHQRLFSSSAESFWQEVERITGVEVRESTVKVQPASGTVVQVFLLAQSVPAGTWSGSGQPD
jgi:uncharacterized protein YbcI